MSWLNFVLLVLIVFIFISVVKLILKRTFKIEVEKKKFFSYNHINKLHGKIDWTIRIFSSFTLIILLYLILYQGYSIYFFLIAMAIFTGTEYIVQAIFEWKYSQNPKQSILTISEMVILIIAIIIIIQFNLFGILS